MMTLKEVKDWLKQYVVADNWKIGIYNNENEKTICVRNLTTNSHKVAIGGSSIKNKGISIVIHWNKNPDETEQIAQKVFSLFYDSKPRISNYQVVVCRMKSDEPICLGVDSQGIYEYVIELTMVYKEDK